MSHETEHDDAPDDIHMLSQPLLTDEGFLNPACMNELELAIKAIKAEGPTFKRLAGNDEWARKKWTFVHDITAAFAKSAVALSPYDCPDHLPRLIGYLAPCLRSEFGKLPADDRGHDEFSSMAKVSLCDINRWLHEILYARPEIRAWNTCRAGDTPELAFTCRYSQQPDPDHDFIDISALFHNACLEIRRERRESDAFDKKFEEEHGRKPFEQGEEEHA